MKRRNFLKIFPAASVTPFVVNGHSLRPFANSKMARVLSSCEGVEDRVLVLIQLKGGNDGVNTLIPLNQYDTYANLRTAIKIPEASLINLDTTLGNNEQIGLHPSLQQVKALYDEGKAAIVQGVGYENMNQSHFKGTDLWLSGGDTASPDTYNIPSGWMGRSLQAFFPDVLGTPTPEMPDPLGIQIGDSSPSLGFHTETEHQNVINLSGQDAAGFYSLVQTIGGAPILNVPDSQHGDELSFIMGVEQSTSLYAQRISQVFAAGSNAISSYPNSQLANQLRTIARLISGGCKTKIYLCQIGGFDTHAAQILNGEPTVGTHADLLQSLSEAVKTFIDDLEGLGIAEQVVACTFSEFGRCARENGSNGTDHGTLAPMFIFGKNIEAGVQGTNVNLSNLTNDNQLQGVQYDYRQIFTTLLQDWLGASNNVLVETMFEGYAKLPVLEGAAVVTPDCYLPQTVGIFDPVSRPTPLSIFPNPASVTAEINFQSEIPFDARLTLHSLGGNLVATQNVRVEPGFNMFNFDVISLPPATYFVRLENRNSGAANVAKLSVVR